MSYNITLMEGTCEKGRGPNQNGGKAISGKKTKEGGQAYDGAILTYIKKRS